MIFENRNDFKVKVPVEGTKPLVWRTLKPKETITCKTAEWANGLKKKGLSPGLKEKPREKPVEAKPEVKPVEDKPKRESPFSKYKKGIGR